MDTQLHDGAEQALRLMREAGFDAAHVSLRHSALTEVNAVHNEASLLRSHERLQLVLRGLLGQRKAATTLDGAALGDTAGLQSVVQQLRADALAAPADEANAVSAGQQLQQVQGPQQPDLDVLVDTLSELLAWRAENAPLFRIGEAMVSHQRTRTVTLTSEGSALDTALGSYAVEAMGAARDGALASSFSGAGGHTHDLRSTPAQAAFGLGEMMLDSVASLAPQPLTRKFVGDLVLSPQALADLIGWLLGQLGDERLISRSSIYSERVGQRIAVPSFTLRSRFDGPGVAPVSADAFVAQAVQPVQAGVLSTLMPSFYGARRTGLAHVPTAAEGWAVDAGDTPLAELLAGVAEGAIAGRLSTGRPAASGDFSAVVKNGFLLAGGQRGPALAESMVAGNMGRMLLDITAISRERLDTGAWLLPWVRVSGLHFS